MKRGRIALPHHYHQIVSLEQVGREAFKQWMSLMRQSPEWGDLMLALITTADETFENANHIQVQSPQFITFWIIKAAFQTAAGMLSEQPSFWCDGEMSLFLDTLESHMHEHMKELCEEAVKEWRE